MHLDQYVNANMLSEGIYSTKIPFIYSENETIETMLLKAQQVKDFTDQSFIGEEYFENLKRCRLVDVEIDII